MQLPGQLEADLEFGLFADDSGLTAQLPDFELNLGLTREVEFDVDGTPMLSGFGAAAGPLAFSSNNLWFSLKIGLAGARQRGTERSWGVGVQLGPRVAAAAGSQGLGAEALLLVARHWPRWSLVANAGAYQEPPARGAPTVDRGLQAGLDLTHDLTDVVGFEAELFAVVTNGVAEHQVGASAGVAWQCNDHVAVSARVVGGLLGAGPGIGVSLGVSPSLRLWR